MDRLVPGTASAGPREDAAPLLSSEPLPTAGPADAVALSFYWGSKNERLPGWVLPLERRPHASLWLVADGVLVVRLAEEERQCPAGTLIAFPTGVARSAENRGATSAWVWSLGFDLTLRGGVDFFRLYAVPAFSVVAEVQELTLPWHSFVEELSNHGETVSMVAEGWARIVVGRWLSALRAAGQLHARRDMDGRLRAVLTAIEENPGAEWSLAAISGRARLSPARVRQLFVQEVGVSPTRYVLGRRIARACELLTATELTAAEICERCGFQDPAYFSRAFRKTVGTPPSEYRRRMQYHEG